MKEVGKQSHGAVAELRAEAFTLLMAALFSAVSHFLGRDDSGPNHYRYNIPIHFLISQPRKRLHISTG